MIWMKTIYILLYEAGLEDGSLVYSGTLIYTGTPGVDDKVPV